MTNVAICPVCSCDVSEGATVACPRCDALHHVDCWSWVGGHCAIFGCAGPNRLPPTEGGAVLDAGVEGESLEARVRSWHRLYTAQWVALGASVTGFSVTLVIVLTAVLFDSVFVWGVPATEFIRLAGFLVGLVGLAATLGGLPVYLALLGPAELQRRRLEEQLGVSLPTPVVLPVRQVADRLDPPPVGRVVLAAISLGEGFLLALALFGFAVAVGWLVPAGTKSLAAFESLLVGVPLLWVLLLRPIKSLMRTRLAYLSSVQNRLVATLKKP